MTMQRRGLPLAFVMTAGNQAQTSQAAMAMAMVADPRITAIGLHIEGVGSVRELEALADAARNAGKPIVAIKVGKSAQAQSQTVSHTASLAGTDAGSRALFKRLGIPLVDTIPVFLETLKLLHVHGPLTGNGIASISCSGGEASLMADAAVGPRRPLAGTDRAPERGASRHAGADGGPRQPARLPHLHLGRARGHDRQLSPPCWTASTSPARARPAAPGPLHRAGWDVAVEAILDAARTHRRENGGRGLHAGEPAGGNGAPTSSRTASPRCSAWPRRSPRPRRAHLPGLPPNRPRRPVAGARPGRDRDAGRGRSQGRARGAWALGAARNGRRRPRGAAVQRPDTALSRRAQGPRHRPQERGRRRGAEPATPDAVVEAADACRRRHGWLVEEMVDDVVAS